MAGKAFGENQNAFLAATSFVGWRIMSNAMQEENGKQNFTFEDSDNLQDFLELIFILKS